MKKLAGWIKTPHGLTLVGVAALALALWFEGPLVAFNGRVPLETNRSRWLAITCLLLAWALGWLMHWLVARLVNLRFVSGVAAQDSASADEGGALAASRAASAEAALLRQRFEQALAVLRKARMKGSLGSQWLYQLPWYMFIGAPGPAKPRRYSIPACAFLCATRWDMTRSAGWAVRVTATGGSPTTPYWSTLPAVTRPRTATHRRINQRGTGS
jgi:hypothetical protein